jgi:hypothetical protein
VVGSTLFVKLPGMEFAPLAAIEAGADVVAVQAALATWFIPILVTGVIAFAVGVFAFAMGIARRTARRVALYEDDHRLPKTLSSAGLRVARTVSDGAKKTPETSLTPKEAVLYFSS